MEAVAGEGLWRETWLSFMKSLILQIEQNVANIAHDASAPSCTTTTMASSTTPAHNAPLPPSSSSATRSSRIAPHSHIKGLGLTTEGYASQDTGGFVGQNQAREVCCPRRSRDLDV